jgi:hypothetical protein
MLLLTSPRLEWVPFLNDVTVGTYPPSFKALTLTLEDEW